VVRELASPLLFASAWEDSTNTFGFAQDWQAYEQYVYIIKRPILTLSMHDGQIVISHRKRVAPSRHNLIGT
jgi:hypothetical protein